jgi:hypothetical protein
MERKYHVRDEERLISFDDRISALRYARSHACKEVFLEVPDQTEWYYWDWDNERWVYP